MKTKETFSEYGEDTQLTAKVATELTFPLDNKIAALIHALESETQLINELTSIISEQREAIAEDNIEKIDNTVFSMHRVMLTLNEARNRRQAMYRILGLGESSGLQAIERISAFSKGSELDNTRNELKYAAESLAREVRINRCILRETLDQKEEYSAILLKCTTTVSPLYDLKGSPQIPSQDPTLFSATA